MGGTCSTHGDIRSAYKMLVGNGEGKTAVVKQSVNMRIILKGILDKLGLGVWIRFIWLRIGSSGGVL
jgi:hypothetical protein